MVVKRDKYTFLHCKKIVMKHPDSAIEHLDGTVNARKVSSHCNQTQVTVMCITTEQNFYITNFNFLLKRGLLIDMLEK